MSSDGWTSLAQRYYEPAGISADLPRDRPGALLATLQLITHGVTVGRWYAVEVLVDENVIGVSQPVQATHRQQTFHFPFSPPLDPQGQQRLGFRIVTVHGDLHGEVRIGGVVDADGVDIETFPQGEHR